MKRPKFSYTLEINKGDPKLYHQDITSVTFYINNDGKKYTIRFDSPVFPLKAIYEAEKWLSKIVTQKYINEMGKCDNWESVEKNFVDGKKPVRGDYLGGYFMLEEIYVKNGNLTYFVGN